MRRIFDMPGSAGGGTRIFGSMLESASITTIPQTTFRPGFRSASACRAARSCACWKSAECLLARHGRGRRLRNGLRKVEGLGRLPGLPCPLRCLQEEEPQNRQGESNARHRFLRGPRVRRSAGRPAPRRFDVPHPKRLSLTRAECNVLGATCSTCSVLRATCPCHVRRATCGVPRAARACRVLNVPMCTARRIWHVARRTWHGTSHVARRTWHVARGTSHVARRTSHVGPGTARWHVARSTSSTLHRSTVARCTC